MTSQDVAEKALKSVQATMNAKRIQKENDAKQKDIDQMQLIQKLVEDKVSAELQKAGLVTDILTKINERLERLEQSETVA